MKNIAIAICFVLVSAMGLSLIGCGEGVRCKSDLEVAAERPVLTLIELQAYDDYKVHDLDDAKDVIRLKHYVADDNGNTHCSDVFVHLDSKTYDLVKGWGRVKYAELKRISVEAGTVPAADKAKSLKQEAR